MDTYPSPNPCPRETYLQLLEELASIDDYAPPATGT
jgi:hypothetical protein